MSIRVMSAPVIFFLALGRTNSALQGLQLGSIHWRIILSKYFALLQNLYKVHMPHPLKLKFSAGFDVMSH